MIYNNIIITLYTLQQLKRNRQIDWNHLWIQFFTTELHNKKFVVNRFVMLNNFIQNLKNICSSSFTVFMSSFQKNRSVILLGVNNCDKNFNNTIYTVVLKCIALAQNLCKNISIKYAKYPVKRKNNKQVICRKSRSVSI